MYVPAPVKTSRTEIGKVLPWRNSIVIKIHAVEQLVVFNVHLYINTENTLRQTNQKTKRLYASSSKVQCFNSQAIAKQRKL